MKMHLSAAILAVSMIAAPLWAAPAVKIKENQHYKVLSDVPVIPSADVEVIEFFSFACPHCAHLEPVLQGWKSNLPKGVKFRRVPVIFRPEWESLAKVYYTLELLKVPKFEMAVFQAIHEQSLNLSQPDVFMAWLGKQKVDVKKARTIYDSFTVSTRISQAKNLAKQYKVEGVPLLMVGGRYLTDVPMAGGMEQVPDVLNQLVTLAQKNPLKK